MADIYLDNPAGRLEDLCHRFRNSAGGKPSGQVWRLIFEVSTTAELFRRLADVTDLVEETIRQVEQLPEAEDPPFLLSGLGEIRNLPSTFENQQMAAHRVAEEFINSSIVRGLGTCSRALRRHAEFRSPTLAPKALEDLLSAVQEWIKEVSGDASLPADLRDVLTSRLMDLQIAILQYRIRGYEGITKAFDSVVGAAVMNQAPATVTERLKRFWYQLTNFAQGASAIGSSAEMGATAIGTITNLIP